MSANTTVKVRVIKGHIEVINVSAISLADARNAALQEHDVVYVLNAWYLGEENEQTRPD